MGGELLCWKATAAPFLERALRPFREKVNGGKMRWGIHKAVSSSIGIEGKQLDRNALLQAALVAHLKEKDHSRNVIFKRTCGGADDGLFTILHWFDWFAWYPVRVPLSPGLTPNSYIPAWSWCWLEKLKRAEVYCSHYSASDDEIVQTRIGWAYRL